MRRLGRKYIAASAFLFIWMLLAVPAWAGEGGQTSGDQRVFDHAGLFSESEIENFESDIAGYQKELKVDLIVVTTDDSRGKNTQDYADDFFDQGGFGRGADDNGVLFLIDMEQRQLTLSTSGSMVRILTDRRIETILDDVYESAGQGDYAGSVERFLQDVAAYQRQGIESGQYNFDTETGRISVHRSIRWYEALLAMGVAGLTGFAACSGVVSQYRMKKEQDQAANFKLAYRANCNFAFQDQTDHMVNKFVTTAIIPRSSNRPGGGGGGGGSSAGRSSTHTSSSGRTHGGGSRRF